VERLSDGFQAVFSNNDLKKFEPMGPEFQSLPQEIQKICSKPFSDLSPEDFLKVMEMEDFDSLPTSLFVSDEEEESSTPKTTNRPVKDVKNGIKNLKTNNSQELTSLDKANEDRMNLIKLPHNLLDLQEESEDDEEPPDEDLGAKGLPPRQVRFGGKYTKMF